ncbi:hypothetical protein [Sphingomonas sp.]|uniref:hypothetical protein n=1 Tax=Sphingomonas sp. TaxID=28214 RepID=UPI00286DBBDF|nr:hypothetical protein [Sphingomonas sp.]
MNRTTRICAAAIGLAGMFAATGAQGGEITGTGEVFDVNGRSDCAYSGLNDTPGGDPPRDPGGRVQSYGYLVGQWGFINPQDADPTSDDPRLQRVPGYACNPNRGRDLHDDG